MNLLTITKKNLTHKKDSKAKLTVKIGLLLALIFYPAFNGLHYLGLFISLIGWSIELKRKEDKLNYLLNIPFIKQLSAILIFSTFSLLYATHFDYGIRYWSMIFQALISYIMLYEILDTKKTLMLFHKITLFASFIISAIALYEYIAGITTRRALSVFSNPNHLATYLLLLAPLALGLATDKKLSNFARSFFLLASITGFITLILTMTRGAWVGIAAGSIIFAFLKDKRSLLLILIVVIAITSFASEDIITRATSIISLESNTNRLEIWQGTFDIGREQPILGQGIGSFRPLYPDYAPKGATEFRHHSHNLLLQTFAELGLIGLSLIFWFGFSLLQGIFRLIKKDVFKNNGLLLGSIFSLTALSLHLQFDLTIHHRGIALTTTFLLATIGFFVSKIRGTEVDISSN
ncbi:O-antigen ligase family protein [Natroniella sulfidigena]|uniref:O-antigen ligase family protein n=1 Tax=Natroniella sulfidigena TaxID=723921 RepID=UPI002009FCD2|nr:O-antigen ligase family protein [Natroniella sulfidigena]MCK8816316.1 O-antigen ligase family protein [Natroniella sulfidigena]